MKIFKFHLKDGHILEENEIPTVKNADQIDKLTLNESAIPMIQNLKFMMPCDVNNPLLGLNGAAYVFGPQKGALPSDLLTFEHNMEATIKHYLKAKHQDKYTEELFKQLAKTPGTGASGGLVASILAVFDKA